MNAKDSVCTNPYGCWRERRAGVGDADDMVGYGVRSGASARSRRRSRRWNYFVCDARLILGPSYAFSDHTVTIEGQWGSPVMAHGRTMLP